MRLHVARMGNNRITFSGLGDNLKRKKTVGRWERRWGDNIKRALIKLDGKDCNCYVWLRRVKSGRLLWTRQ
jgi:hypothetical protein